MAKWIILAAVLAALTIVYLARDSLRCDGKTEGARIGRVMVLEGC